MPEFILDHGSPDASRMLNTLDAFTVGYIEAMFFTSTGTGDDAEDNLEHASVAELAPETLALIKKDCEAFQLTDACGAIAWDFEPEQAGRDFWYTRNGHGCGFWDGGYEEHGDALTAASKAFRELDLYRGDDGLLYLA